jgi:predicted NUDIX family phosphoesterase
VTARVFVVDRAAWFGGAWPQGFVAIAAGDAGAFLARAHHEGRFVDRPLAEETPAWKQWIPYCVLRCAPPAAGVGASGPMGVAAARDAGVFVVRRTKGQSEARLHGQWSIGLGGHIEPEDEGAGAGGGASFFAAALQRELSEELDLRRFALPAPRFAGLLNDDSTEVGAVHAGLVYTVDVPLAVAAAAAAVRIAETSKMHGGFTPLVDFAELWQHPPQFETWSRTLIQAGIADPIGNSRPSEVGGQGG